MIVLVTGGRDFGDVSHVLDAINHLNELEPIDLLVHGDATGADTLADAVCKELGITRIKCPANWEKFGRPAGAIRNKSMLDLFKIDLVLAFPGGKGTAHMKKNATELGIPVMESHSLLDESSST